MLVDNLKILLGTTFTIYVKAANFHWNVEGPDFVQHHELFGDIYFDLYSSIDTLAEKIRALGHYAPGSLSEYVTLSTIKDQGGQPTTVNKLTEMLDNSIAMLSLLNQTFEDANTEKRYDIADFLSNRIAATSKQIWKLHSILKTGA